MSFWGDSSGNTSVVIPLLALVYLSCHPKSTCVTEPQVVVWIEVICCKRIREIVIWRRNCYKAVNVACINGEIYILKKTISEKDILQALKKFAEAVTAKMNQLTAGEPEDQLRGPFEVFMQEVGQALALEVVCTGETKLKRIGTPDYAVHAAKLLAGVAQEVEEMILGKRPVNGASA